MSDHVLVWFSILPPTILQIDFGTVPRVIRFINATHRAAHTSSNTFVCKS